MDRRQFTRSIVVLAPLLPGCTTSVAYDRTKYGDLRRVGIIAHPQRFDVFASSSMNIYARAGYDEAMRNQVKSALSAKCQEFGSGMRKQIAATLTSYGINSTEIAYRDDGSIINPRYRIFRTPLYKDAGEPLYLESQISLCFAQLQDGIAPGAGTWSQLITPDGETLWSTRISIGPSRFSDSIVIGVPTTRFKDISDVVNSPDMASAVLMSFATPLGRNIGEALVRDTAQS